ncbi:MAG: hypothetical protein EYC70_07510 [Planctomycetota bacterium]|nr:MAG: hypothetical protein EYC70_07510 [Planctomycetota bacterium]
MAHIGVLRALADAQVPIAGIAGTSIGAIIGGLYAADALDRYEDIVRRLDRKSVLYFLDPVLPASGLMGGGRLGRLLHSLIGDRAIESLPIRFCAVACDLEQGREVRLDGGDLLQALRASWAIPGLFTPQRVRGRWLVDGGVVAPVPVGAARALGLGPVAAVDLHAHAFPSRRPLGTRPPHEQEAADQRRSLDRLAHDPTVEPEVREAVREALAPPSGPGQRLARRVVQIWQRRERAEEDRPPSLTSIVNDALALTQCVLSRLQMAQDPPELVIRPHLPGVGLLDYQRAADIIAEGERATREALATPAGATLFGRA